MNHLPGPEEKILIEEIDAAHDRYRQSGTALMTTVIGLSVGAIYSLGKKMDEYPWKFAFLVPLFLALYQQLFHFFAGRWYAQSRYHLGVTMAFIRKELISVEGLKNCEPYNLACATFKEATGFFDFSEALCALVVFVFVLVGLFIVGEYVSWLIALIGGGVLMGILWSVWRYKRWVLSKFRLTTRFSR